MDDASRDDASTDNASIDAPIVEEVRRARERLFQLCGGDIDQLLDRLQAAEAQDRHRLVDPEEVGRRMARPEGEAGNREP